MYDELVKKIRHCATDPMHCLSCAEDKDGRCFARLMTQSADAIEELQKRVPKAPHGRCVDADKLTQEMRLFIKENMLSRDDARELLETIKDAPTIIPAEEGE